MIKLLLAATGRISNKQRCMSIIMPDFSTVFIHRRIASQSSSFYLQLEWLWQTVPKRRSTETAQAEEETLHWSWSSICTEETDVSIGNLQNLVITIWCQSYSICDCNSVLDTLLR